MQNQDQTEIAGRLNRPGLRYSKFFGNEPDLDRRRVQEAGEYIVIAGNICTWMCIVFPVFIFGSIYCGIQAIKNGQISEGKRILILSPFLSLAGMVVFWIIWTTLAFWMADHAVKDFSRRMRQEMMPKPGLMR